MPLDSRGAEAKLVRILRMLNEELPYEVELTGELLQTQIVARSPTKEQEYNSLMLGDGESTIPLVGDRSGDTDGRTRLQKAPGSWLVEVAVDPLNRAVATSEGVTTLSVGNMSLLNTSSSFSYTNLRGDKTEETHTVGPYFQFFEYGSTWVVVPVFQSTRTYPLRPDETTKVFSLQKSIPAYNAYLGMTLYPLFRDNMREILTDISKR